MIMGISSLVFVPLLAISMAHFAWAFGSTWPAGDVKSLARAVTGFRGAERMPPRLLSALAAIATLAAGVWALAMADPGPGPALTLGGAVLALIFVGRGGLGYTAKWRALTPVEPFRSLDRRIYSPLCLAIGAGFVFLTLWRLL